MELGKERKAVGDPPKEVRGPRAGRSLNDFDRSSSGLYGLDQPVRSLGEEIRGRQEAERQRVLALLEGLPLTHEQLAYLSPQPSVVGNDFEVADRYLAWWQQLDGLIRGIQNTPPQALSKAQWDALSAALSIAHAETGNLQSHLQNRPLPSSSFEAMANRTFRRRPVEDDSGPSRRLD